MSNTFEIPVTIGTGGKAIVTICPQMMTFVPPTVNTTSLYYPWAAVSTSNTNQCYAGATLYNGPFLGQVPSLVGYYPDQTKCTFQCTQSLLNASGRIYCGVFYEWPNQSFALNSLNTVDLTTTLITPSGI